MYAGGAVARWDVPVLTEERSRTSTMRVVGPLRARVETLAVDDGLLQELRHRVPYR